MDKRLLCMKKILAMITLLAILVSACASPKPAYKTRKGKKKLKHYNTLQYGGQKG